MEERDDYKTGFKEGARYARQGDATFRDFARYERINADPFFKFADLDLPADEPQVLEGLLARGEVTDQERYKMGWMYGVLANWRNTDLKGPQLW